MPRPTDTQPAHAPRGGRIAALVAAGVAGLLALALLVAGGVLLWGSGQRDADGFVSTGVDRFSTATYALKSESLRLDTGTPSWLVDQGDAGTVRLTVDPHAGKDVFVGIARTRTVDGYLAQTSHATVRDLSYAPFSVNYERHGGGSAPGAPTAKRFWVASAHGTGTRTVTWHLRRGHWSVVVMNADGSPGIDAGISAGAKVPFLAPAGWSALGGGALLLLIASTVLVVATRPRAPRAEGPVGSTPAVA